MFHNEYREVNSIATTGGFDCKHLQKNDLTKDNVIKYYIYYTS